MPRETAPESVVQRRLDACNARDIDAIQRQEGATTRRHLCAFSRLFAANPHCSG